MTLPIGKALRALGECGMGVRTDPLLPHGVTIENATLADLLAKGYRPTGEAEYVYNERMGMADGLKMPTHCGSPAWLVAVGEAMQAENAERIVTWRV